VQTHRRSVPAELVAGLHDDYGVAWNDIATVAGVSRHALRKWREGTSQPSRSHWEQLCRLAAFGDRLHALGGRLGTWLPAVLDFEVGAPSSCTVADVLAAGRFQSALSHFLQEVTDRQLLADVFPGLVPRSGLATIHHDAESFTVEITDLPVLAEGETLDAASDSALNNVRDFLTDWFESLRELPEYRPMGRLVLELHSADADGRLREVLFGE